jgi:hypothetical protein
MRRGAGRRGAGARALVTASLLALACAAAAGASGARRQEGEARRQEELRRGSVADLRDRRRAALLVVRTQTVDARDPAIVAVELYRQAAGGMGARPHVAGHRAVARQLNKYIRKHRSLTAVKSAAEADFVLVFNVLRVRGSFIPDEPYIFGKLFVIARGTQADPRPSVVWESKGYESRIDKALGDFLKALRAVRGER